MEKWWNRQWVIIVLLLALTMSVYTNIIRNGFHYEDFQAISENVLIRSLSNILMFFTPEGILSYDQNVISYRPVLLLSYALNYSVSGTEPWSYYLFQMIIHAGSVLLVYWLVVQFFDHKKMAFLAAVLFGLHPINIESVNYLTARSSLLSGFYSLVAIFSYLYFRSGEGPPGRKHRMAYIGSVSFFVLAILTKETAIILPLLLVAYDFYFSSEGRGRPYLQWMLVYTPFVLLAGLYLVILNVLEVGIMAAPAYQPDRIMSLFTATKVLARYLLLMIWPINLNVDHPISHGTSIVEGEILLSIAMIGLLGVGIWLLYRQRRWLSFCGLWILVALLPATVLPFMTGMGLFQENQAYLASAGYAMAMSWGFFNLLARGNVIWLRNGLIIVLCTLYGLSVVYRNTVWRDEVTLWSDALNKNPHSVVAHLNLGGHYYRQREWDLAAQVYGEVLRLAPEEPKALSNLAMIYYAQGRLDEAEETFQKAVRVLPDDPTIHGSFGLLLSQAGKYDRAIDEYKEAIRLSPEDWRTIHNLGWTYARLNRWDEALNSFQMALQVNSTSPEIYTSLGLASKALGRVENAQQLFERALSIDPTIVSAYEQLGELYVQQGKWSDAMKLMEKVLEINPQNAQAHHVLGFLSEQQESFDAALQHYRMAVNIDPNRYGSFFNLGNVYWRFGETELALKAYQTAVKLQPDFFSARLNSARLLEYSGRRQEAIDQYQLVLDRARSLGNQSVERVVKESLEKIDSELSMRSNQTRKQ